MISKRQKDIIVVLEDIHDPHNAAAIFRSCDAFGIQNVYLIFETHKSYNPSKIGRVSSASANKWLTFTKFNSTKNCFDQLKKDGYKIFGTILGDDCESIYDQKFIKYDKIALVIGNEHSGLSQTAIEMVDKKIIIPMRGIIQSFNVSVSAAICMAEITRQRMKKGKNFLLDSSDQKKLLNDLINR